MTNLLSFPGRKCGATDAIRSPVGGNTRTTETTGTGPSALSLWRKR